MKVHKILSGALVLFWFYMIYHFGTGTLVSYPRWEHYVVEGYFLFSVAIFTWLWVKLRPSEG